MRNLSMFVLVLGLVACRGGGSGGGDDTGSGSDSGTSDPNDVTIYEIQNPAMPACDPADPTTCVELKIKGVVVTAIDSYGNKTGDFWVQEPEGGELSGVHVYGAPLDQVGALAIGDVVDIAGAQKSEFALTSDTSGNKLTELEPVSGGTMSVTKTGQSMQLEPHVVDALAIGKMSDFNARAAEWEKWEGVLVKVTNVGVFSDDACVGSACSDMTLRKFDITGDVLVESALSAMPMPAVKQGDCLGNVTGVVDYFFDYQILPRTTAEIATGGTSCPVENQMATCSDGIDNDGNGFADCADNQCITASASCRTVNPTIASIQAGTTTGAVELQDAIVTAVSFNKKDVWVSTSLTAAANEGIQLHFNTAVPNTVVIGKAVNVIGKVTEFNDSMMVGTGTVTEINGIQITVGAAAAVTPVPVTGQTAATLNNDTTGEPYESVLVTLTQVKISTVADATNHVGSFTQGTTVFKYDDAIFRIPETGANARPVGTCYSTITGIWTYNVFDNNWVFYPRASAANSALEDGTLGTGC